MARYKEIVGGSWEQRSVFPESIPHLFHHDMAYLWVLEQQKEQRPRTWLTRIEAWKTLLRLFLLDQVTVNSLDLQSPLKEAAERFGLRRVTWLRSSHSKQAIGVLSPTVIVRPLPDFAESDVERWRAELKDNEREFNHLVYVAIQDLGRSTGVSDFARRLADVLEREFTPVEMTQRPPAGKKTAVPLLHRVTWEIRKGEEAPVLGIDLQVRSGASRAIPESIPRCTACNTRLLFEEGAPAIEVTGDPVRLQCLNPQCPSPAQTLPLDWFGIWLRGTAKVVRWLPDRTVQPMPENLRLPPEPTAAGNELLYEWNAAILGGEPFLRFLRLRFPDRDIVEVPLGSIFFTKLVVPGQFASFGGSAVLPEWIEAIDATRAASVQPSQEQKQISFRDLKVKGWPVTFNHVYTEKSLVFEPGISLGVFPDPSVVGLQWKWFRSFAEGGGVAYEVQADGQRLLPNLVSTEEGLPAAVSLRSATEPATGVSYSPRRRERTETYGGTATASIAIDFGTTNTVVYYQPPGEGHVARSETHGLKPREISSNVLWFAENPNWRDAEVLGNFLPGPRYRPNVVADEYIVPSEMWRVGSQGVYLPRWAGEHPDPQKKDAKPEGQFKWDKPELGPDGYLPARVAYLRELLLQFLPLVMRKFGVTQVGDVKLGISFPLAFEHRARVGYLEMLKRIKNDVERLSGINVRSLLSINESKACVNAFGGFNDETFLVADMGGGTLDVALFSFFSDGSTQMHQMGSLRYAGERCVAALATQLTPSVDSIQLRDAIARNESHEKYGTQSAEKLATRFATIAFEFLRTMVAAYRLEKERPEEEIRVVLVGNGWHLVEAFSSDVAQRGGRSVYLGVYADMVKAIGDPNLTFYDKSPLSEFPSSKHLVVAGALQNVTSQNSVHELSEVQVAFAKLPAGRSFTLGVTPVTWSALVGEGVDLPGGLDLNAASNEKILVKTGEGPPEGSQAWTTRFVNSMGLQKNETLPYPTDPELLRELRNSLGGSPPKMRRGPLQVILELEWSKALMRKKGSVQ